MHTSKWPSLSHPPGAPSISQQYHHLDEHPSHKSTRDPRALPENTSSHQKKTTTTPNLNISCLSTSFSCKLMCFHHIKRAGKCNNSIDFLCRNFPGTSSGFPCWKPCRFPPTRDVWWHIDETFLQKNFCCDGQILDSMEMRSQGRLKGGPVKIGGKPWEIHRETFHYMYVYRYKYIDMNKYKHLYPPKKKDQDFKNRNFNWIILSNAFFHEPLGMEVQTHAT